MTSSKSFQYTALALFISSLAHIIGHFLGPEAIGFMGAPPDFVEGARQGTWLYYTTILGIIGLLFTLAYAAYKDHKGKAARLFLWIFAIIFTFRGLLFILFIPPIISGEIGASAAKFWFHFFASLYVLSIGLALVRGLWKTRIVTHHDIA